MRHDEFYDERTRDGRARKRSGEMDFGVLWRDERDWPQYRISVIHATGEVYALRQSHPEDIEILAVLDSRGELIHDHLSLTGRGSGCSSPCPYEAAEHLLDEWAEVCGSPNSMAWIRERVVEHAGTVQR